jgi:two-component system sensor histidine kinase BaeS
VSRLRRSLTAKVLAGQLAVIIAGSVTLLLVALSAGPVLFHRHIEDALGFVPDTVLTHLDEAFGQALAISLAVAVTAATVTAAGVGWLVSTRIARPVRALAGAARRVSRGDYEARVQHPGEDELGVLARAFNEMAGALASAEASRGRLLSDVAHELRTPLATIDAHLEGLADGVVAPEEQTWHILRAETARLRRLSEDIARVSRAEERQLDLRLEIVRPAQLLESAARAQRPAFDAKRVELTVDVEHHVPAVELDPDRAREVLALLLDNALRHTQPGGRVTLFARRAGSDAVLAVEDTGDGLEPSDLERVFERFYRVDPSRSRDRGGSGIGLTIARAIVEAHGGRLWAESPGRGHGSRFLLQLPAAA